MTTLPNMGLDLPVRGPAGSGEWGDTEDSNLGKVDAHDHTAGAGARIPVAALNINSDVSFGSTWAPVNLHHITLASILVSPTTVPTKSLFVSNADNELYFKNNSGNNIKVTSGNTLNVAAFVGGIGGDYTAVGAAEAFDDSQKRYTFKDGSTNWARGVFGGVRLIDFGTTKSVFVGLIAPSSLAASYTMTLPAALPGSQLVLQLDATGNVVPSNTIPVALATQDITLAANTSVTVSGTGDYKHGTRTISIPVSPAGVIAIGSEAASPAGAPGTGQSYRIPIQLPVGSRILALRAVIQDLAGGPATTCNLRLIAGSGAGAGIGNTGGTTLTTIAASASSTGSGLIQQLSITPSPLLVSAGQVYLAVLWRTSGAGVYEVYSLEVDYDRP